jgi:SAM-dependent methyltransferase
LSQKVAVVLEELCLSKVYEHPEYYEIAFSFRDIASEANVFEECFKKYSLIPVSSVLELGCGNCPHMEEMVRRGYKYTGIDNSRAMIEYSKKRAVDLDGVDLILGDMLDFSLPEEVDFAFILLGSLYTTTSEDIHRHFDSVRRNLRAGGLYFLDWCVQFEIPWACEGGDSCEFERDGIKVKTTKTSQVTF